MINTTNTLDWSLLTLHCLTCHYRVYYGGEQDHDIIKSCCNMFVVTIRNNCNNPNLIACPDDMFTWNKWIRPHHLKHVFRIYLMCSKTLARKSEYSYINKLHIFQCMGKTFCVEFHREPLKLHKKTYPYIERDDFYSVLKIYELSDLQDRKRLRNASLILQRTLQSVYNGTSIIRYCLLNFLQTLIAAHFY